MSKPNLFVSGVLWNRESVLALLPLIDCAPGSGCQKCCTHPKPIVAQEYEVERIAHFLGEDAEALKARMWDGALFALGTPCPYRTEGGCAIHPVRPVVCKYYPLQRVEVGGNPVVAVFTGWCGAGRRVIEQLEAWHRGERA